MDNSVKELIDSTLKSMDGLFDTKNIVGDAINTPDGTIIIPIAKVSVGFGGGGSDFFDKANNKEKVFGGGVGGGFKMDPQAFLVINNNNVRLIPMGDGASPINKAIDLVPEVVDKVNGFFRKNK